MSLRRPSLACLALAVVAFAARAASAQARAGSAQESATQAGTQEEPKAPAGEAAEKAAPAKPGLETVFPQESMLFVGIDDLATLRAEWRASAWGRLFADEKAAPVRDAVAALLPSIAAQSKEEAGTDLVEAAELVSGRFGAALVGNLAEIETSEEFAGFFAADAGDHAAELRDRILPSFQRMVERGEAVLKSDTAGAVEYVSIQPTREDDHSSISLAASGPTLAMGIASGSYVERDDFARFLGGLAGDAKDTLAQSPAFRSSLAAQPGGVKFWLDTGAALRAAMAGKAEDDAESAMERALGLDQFGAFAGRFALDAREMRVDAHQAWGGGWLPKLIDAWLAGGDLSLFKLVPSEVSFAIALHLDFAAGVDATDKASKELGGPSPFGGGGDGGGEAEAGAPADEQAFDVRRDVLEHLDGRVALFVAPTDATEALPMLPGSEPVNLALVLGVKNAEALTASIDKVLRSQGMHAARRRTEFEGFQVYTLPIMPLSVSYAIAADFAVVSMSPTLLQDVLRRKGNEELESLASSANFRRQLDGMTQSNAVLIWSKTASQISGAAEASSMSGADEPVIGPDGQVIIGGGEGSPPDEDTLTARVHAVLQTLEHLDPTLLTKHLPAGSLLGIAVDEAGIRLEGLSR